MAEDGPRPEFSIEGLREDVEALLGRLDTEGLGGATEGSKDGEVWRLNWLPEEDRPNALEAFRRYLRSLASVTTKEDLLDVLPKARETFAPWVFTSEEWMRNPNVERLSAALVGDGPVLEPPPNASSDEPGSGRLTLRAADALAAEQWQTVAKRVPEAAMEAYAGLTGRGFERDPHHCSVQGRLGRVSVGGHTFARHGAVFHGTIMRGRNRQRDPVTGTSVTFGKKLHSWRWGKVRVLYAGDDRRATVWITDAYVLKAEQTPRSGQWSFPGKWSYSPPEEN